MAPKLYYRIRSPPCRAVLLTAKALGITLEETVVSIEEGLSPEFIKINPQHTVPTLEDDGKIIWDSHAIIIYLVSKYGKDDSLYPNDDYERAVINQRLHFDTGIVHPVGKAIRDLIVKERVKTIPDASIKKAADVYALLECLLEGHQWVAGDKLTLADMSLIPSITSLNFMAPINATRYKNITAWIERAKKLPFYDVNQKGLDVTQKDFSALMNN